MRPTLPSEATVVGNWRRAEYEKRLAALLAAVVYMDGAWNSYMDDDCIDIAAEAIGELRRTHAAFLEVSDAAVHSQPGEPKDATNGN